MPTKRAPVKPTPLSEEDLRRIADAVRSSLYRGMHDLAAQIQGEVLDELRLAPLAAELADARARRGLEVKALAKRVKVPQYVIHQIERGNPTALRPGVLERYADGLGMKEALDLWKRNHPELALRLGRPKNQSPILAMIEQQALSEYFQRSLLGGPAGPTGSRGASEARPELVDKALQLKIVLEDVDRPVWRRVLVRSDVTLADLHRIIQIAMGWSDSHLYQFDIGDERYCDPGIVDDLGPDVRDARKTRLSSLALETRATFGYEYDFGDGWMHRVTIERIRDVEGTDYPRCVGGARACPPEDCGGPGGYQELLEILADPDHPEHEERKAWLHQDFDPEAFDAAAINSTLARHRPRRRGRPPGVTAGR